MAIVHVNARQYWVKSNGYTETSVSVWVDGEHVGSVGLTYGRDRSTAVEMARDLLKTVGFPVDFADRHWEESWRDAGHILVVDVSWVGKRKDAYLSNIWRVWRDGDWRYAESGWVATA
jgi:hypothetical protein